jgi:hypothetical protein
MYIPDLHFYYASLFSSSTIQCSLSLLVTDHCYFQVLLTLASLVASNPIPEEESKIVRKRSPIDLNFINSILSGVSIDSQQDRDYHHGDHGDHVDHRDPQAHQAHHPHHRQHHQSHQSHQYHQQSQPNTLGNIFSSLFGQNNNQKRRNRHHQDENRNNPPPTDADIRNGLIALSAFNNKG